MNVFGEKQQHQAAEALCFILYHGLKLYVKSNVRFPMIFAIPFHIPFTLAAIKYDTIIRQKEVVNERRIAH